MNSRLHRAKSSAWPFIPLLVLWFILLTAPLSAVAAAIPDGDLTGNGVTDVFDALRALRISVGLDLADDHAWQHGDVAPLIRGEPQPDGAFTVFDALLILQKAVGLINWDLVPQPPSVIARYPAAESSGVPLNATLTVTFSELVDPATVTSATFSVWDGSIPVSGTVTASGMNATFTPQDQFSPLKTYAVTLSGSVRDLSGTPMAGPVSWRFTTGPDMADPQHFFPFDQGNSWRFQGVITAGGTSQNFSNSMLITGSRLVNGVSTTVFRENNPNNSGQPDESYLVKNAVGITNYGSSTSADLSARMSPYLELRFPLTVGDSFVQLDLSGVDLGEDLDGDGRNETVKVRSVVTVAGFDSVSVPAGSFTGCVKLVRQMTLTLTLSASGMLVSGSDNGAMWLAPGVGPVKQTETLAIAGISQTVTEELSEYFVMGQGPGLSNGPLGFAPQPTGLTVRNGTMFWSDTSGVPVKKQSVRGGEISTLVPRMGNPSSLAASGGWLFWVEESSERVLKRSAPDGSFTTTLASGSGGIADLAVDDTSVYWVTTSSSYPVMYHINRVPIYGGPMITLASTERQIVALAADHDYIYWEEESSGPVTFPDGPEGSAIRRVAKAGGTPQVLVNGLLNGLITPPSDPIQQPGSWWPRGGIALQGGELFFGETSFNGRYRLFKVPTSGGVLTEMAAVTTGDGSNFIRRLTAYEGKVVWLDGSSARALPTNGGDPQTLASLANPPRDLAVADGRVFWSEDLLPEQGVLKSAPLAGGAVTILAQGGDVIRRLATDTSYLYWGGGDGELSRIVRHPLSGGPPATVLAGSSGQVLLAADAVNIYFATKTRIIKVPMAGGAPETIARGNGIASLATDGSHVYWLEEPLVRVLRAPVEGGPAITLFSSATIPWTEPSGPIQVRGGYVYWMSHLSAINRLPVGGGSPETIVTVDVPSISDFVTNGAYVYYILGGAITRAPVPGGVFVADGMDGSSTMALDDQHIYWIDQFFVHRAKLALDDTTFLVSGLANDQYVSPGIALNGASVYWTETASGAIMKMTPR